MKVGLVARCDDRGLGLQTWEAWRHFDFDRTLVVDMGLYPEAFPQHLERYPGATVTRFGLDGWMVEAEVRPWLDGLDVVFTCETAYDWRLPGWCESAGARLVCQVNPEFMLPQNVDQPVTWWNPSTWRMEYLPAGTIHVPVPVAISRFANREPRTGDRGVRFLHVAGKWAVSDRNGTQLVQAAVRRSGADLVRMTIASQDHVPRLNPAGRNPIAYREGNQPDYWDLYAGHDVLVMPRRYGGLCLPAQEAMAAGLAVVMPDCSPNVEMWPVVPVPSRERGAVDTPAGRIPLFEVDPDQLARTLERLAKDRDELAHWQLLATAWARSHSWEVWAPRYQKAFQRATTVPA